VWPCGDVLRSAVSSERIGSVGHGRVVGEAALYGGVDISWETGVLGGVKRVLWAVVFFNMTPFEASNEFGHLQSRFHGTVSVRVRVKIFVATEGGDKAILEFIFDAAFHVCFVMAWLDLRWAWVGFASVWGVSANWARIERKFGPHR